MADRISKPKILPPAEQDLIKVWRWRVLPKYIPIIKFAGMVPALGVVGWLLQNFLQLRGVVNVTASRIDLAFLALAVFVAGCAATIGFSHKRIWRVVMGIFIFLVALGVDRLTPKPQPQVAISSPSTQPSSPNMPTAAEIADEVAKKVPRQHDTQVIISEQAHASDKVEVEVTKAHKEPEIGPPIEIVPHPYDLSPDRRKKLLSLLKPEEGAHDVLRFGCMASSDSSCVAAGNFMVLFSEAGWKIDSNQVFRAEPTIPSDGVSLVTHVDEAPVQPPHLGIWHKESASEVKIGKASLVSG